MTEQKTEEQIKEDIKSMREQLKEIKSKGSWKHLYKNVRQKTLDLEKDETVNKENKIVEFVKFFEEYKKENNM